MYNALTREQPGPIPRYVEQAVSLSSEALPVLATVISLMLRSLLCSYQADHRAALEHLRHALHALRKREGETVEDTNWFWSVKTVLLYNLAAESMNVFLRNDAMKYIIKAAAVIEEHTTSDLMLREKVSTYRTRLLPGGEFEALPTFSVKTMATLPAYQGTPRALRSASQRSARVHSSREHLRVHSRPPWPQYT